jgi:hypothetical protein
MTARATTTKNAHRTAYWIYFVSVDRYNPAAMAAIPRICTTSPLPKCEGSNIVDQINNKVPKIIMPNVKSEFNSHARFLFFFESCISSSVDGGGAAGPTNHVIQAAALMSRSHQLAGFFIVFGVKGTSRGAEAPRI